MYVLRIVFIAAITMSMNLYGDITAAQLSKVFKINKYNAGKLFTNKIITVTGEVAGVTSKNGALLLGLKGSGALMVVCQFPESDAVKLIQLKTGQNTIISGLCKGGDSEGVLLVNCKFINRSQAVKKSVAASNSRKFTRGKIAQFRKSIIIVEGRESNGTGFFCKLLNGKNVIVTNAHNIWKNKNIKFKCNDGGIIKVRGCYFEPNRDIAFITLADPEKYPSLEIDKESGTTPVNTPVCVLGNSLGAGVTTEIYGALTAVGPDKIESSARFVSGNSGSPIISLKSGKVLGVATYATIENVDSLVNASFSGIRRFGYRIDNCNLKKLQRYKRTCLKKDIQMEEDLDDHILEIKELIKILQYEPPVKRYLVTTVSTQAGGGLRFGESIDEYQVKNRGGVWSKQRKKRIAYKDKNKNSLKIFDRKLDRKLEDIPGMKDFVRSWNNQFVVNSRYYADKESNHLVSYTAYYNLLKNTKRELDKFNKKYKYYTYNYSMLKKVNQRKYNLYSKLCDEFDSAFDKFEVK